MPTPSLGPPSWIADLSNPPAASWARVALQVNPYAYVLRHGHDCDSKSEMEYNESLVRALVAAEVELIAITDHFRYSDSVSLAAAAQAAGVCVLPAFEACSSEGIHFLALFPEGTTSAKVQEAIWKCDLHDAEAESPVSKLSALAMLENLGSDGAVVIAAHVTQSNGLLSHLSGMPRSHIWTSPLLRAAAIPGSVQQAPENQRPILENNDSTHKRDRPLALINAGDVSAPGDIRQPGASCWLRMTEPSLAGVKQAFMDPESRVRLHSDPTPDPRPVIRALHWDGGFLDGQTIVLSEQLNVLVGAPGSGKSTVIESLRAAFMQEGHSERAQVDHDDLCASALADTTVSVVIEHPHPSPTTLVVQRTMPHPSVVVHADSWRPSGRPLDDLVPWPEIYGQHEVADLARDQWRRTMLLERFVSSAGDSLERIAQLASDLDDFDDKIARREATVEEMAARVALLAGKEEQLEKWQEQGIAEQLAEETLFQREHRLIKTVEDRLDGILTTVESLASALPKPVDPDGDVASSPFLLKLTAASEELTGAIEEVTSASNGLRAGVQRRREAVAKVRAEWKLRRRDAEERLAETRRSLGTPELATGFKALQDEVDVLRALAKELPDESATLGDLIVGRTAVLNALEQARAARTTSLRKAAANVTTRLGGRVRVTVTSTEDMAAFDAFVRTYVKGYRKQTTELFLADPRFSFRALNDAIAQGETDLRKRWPMTDSQARLLCQLTPTQTRELDRLGPVLATKIELNVGLDGNERWRRLEDLSKGQKATAVLLLLLLDSEAPLVVDQPEDDLDNRFIVEDVVPALRRSKRGRQFILATHNANVPVLADAELVAGLTAEGDATSQGSSQFRPEHVGSIDRHTVKELVEGQLEGGHDAFEERARRYGHAIDRFR